MSLDIVTVARGLTLLLVGGEAFIVGAIQLARRLGLSS